MIDVSVVILSHNRRVDISGNVGRLLRERHDADEFEIVVVDNHSTDGTVEVLQELRGEYPTLKLVLNTGNLGVGGGRNAGFAVTSRQFIVSLDDDSAIATESVRRVPKLFKDCPQMGLAAFRIVHPASGELQNPHGDESCLVANHHGAGFAFRREVYAKLGGISEDCDYGADELDFAVRVHAAGWEIRYTPEITVLHNSMPRDVAQEEWRLERWIYNYVRVFYTFFPRRMAWAHSWRVVLPLLVGWCFRFGLVHLTRAGKAMSDGRRAGRRAYKTIPQETVRYYSDRHLRPDVGNIWLSERLWRKVWRYRAGRCKVGIV